MFIGKYRYLSHGHINFNIQKDWNTLSSRFKTSEGGPVDQMKVKVGTSWMFTTQLEEWCTAQQQWWSPGRRSGQQPGGCPWRELLPTGNIFHYLLNGCLTHTVVKLGKRTPSRSGNRIGIGRQVCNNMLRPGKTWSDWCPVVLYWPIDIFRSTTTATLVPWKPEPCWSFQSHSLPPDRYRETEGGRHQLRVQEELVVQEKAILALSGQHYQLYSSIRV